jgi:hypothetical protein
LLKLIFLLLDSGPSPGGGLDSGPAPGGGLDSGLHPGGEVDSGPAAHPPPLLQAFPVFQGPTPVTLLVVLSTKK